MAVVLTSSDGCVLDHDQALMSVYSQCVVSASCLSTQWFHDVTTENECNRDRTSFSKNEMEMTHSLELDLCSMEQGSIAQGFILDGCDTHKDSCDVKSEDGHNNVKITSSNYEMEATHSLTPRPQKMSLKLKDGSLAVKDNTSYRCSNSNTTEKTQTLSLTSRLQKVSLKLKDGFFGVNVPFMMDTQFEKVDSYLSQRINDDGKGAHISVADILRVLQSKKSEKRKRKLEKTRSSEEERLLTIHKSLVDTAREQGIFRRHVTLPVDNNVKSRQCSRLDHTHDVFSPLLVSTDGTPLIHTGDCLEPLDICSRGSGSFKASELIQRRVGHRGMEGTVIEVEGSCYILPPHSRFLLSNLHDFSDHLYLQLVDGGYDLIVLDPPWENKSVKRKKSYDMVSERCLETLPVSRLARPGCVVGVWITNNQRLEDCCLNSLFPAWGLTYLARWHWLKVTQTGDLITSMDGHKKPFEVLLLGTVSADCRDDGGDGGGESERVTWRDVPMTRVLMSVPCSLHSKKPPLADVLQPFLPANPQCLELFARNLWPGWTSWGREALKHQNLLFYEKTSHPFSSSVIPK